MEDFIIKTMVVGPIETNMYLISRDRKGIVVDPGFTEIEKNIILKEFKKTCDEITAVLITHGHFDHIPGLRVLKEQFHAAVYCHELDQEKLMDAEKNGSAFFGFPLKGMKADSILRDEQELNLLDLRFKVFHTPGHTSGSICLLLEDRYLFSGDTIFESDIGRTDFEDSSYDQIMQSIKEKILTLPDAVIIYPGHGRSTTVGKERRNYQDLL